MTRPRGRSPAGLLRPRPAPGPPCLPCLRRASGALAACCHCGSAARPAPTVSAQVSTGDPAPEPLRKERKASWGWELGRQENRSDFREDWREGPKGARPNPGRQGGGSCQARRGGRVPTEPSATPEMGWRLALLVCGDTVPERGLPDPGALDPGGPTSLCNCFQPAAKNIPPRFFRGDSGLAGAQHPQKSPLFLRFEEKPYLSPVNVANRWKIPSAPAGVYRWKKSAGND